MRPPLILALAAMFCARSALCQGPIVQCGALRGIDNGTVHLSGTVFGSVADFSCDHGFKLVGNSKRTCGTNGSDGQWSGESPHCKVVECGRPEAIVNGAVITPGTVFGSKAEYYCSNGFKLVGDNSRTCGANGRWTGEHPRCEEIWCPEEMLVQFTERGGIVVVGETPVVGRQRNGTTARYICPQNTVLVGSDFSICQENGVWLFELPTCKLVGCAALQDIANGSVRYSGTVIGSVAAFSCDRGFKLAGDKTRTCGADGRWTGESPHCEVSRGCSLEQFFDVAPLGLVTSANTSYVRQNTILQVFCDGSDLTLVGNGSPVTCLEDDSWAIPSHMKCIEACDNFDTGPGGPTVEGRKNSYDLGDSVTLSCIQNGSELQPHIERITCLGNRWSEEALPVCVPAEDKRPKFGRNKFLH